MDVKNQATDKKISFQGDCLPVLIGSLPLGDHRQATELILRYTPDIPLWAQLPTFRKEGMLAQFLPGMPGCVGPEEKESIDIQSPDFEAALLAFYERYLEVMENGLPEDGLFALDRDRAAGFFELVDRLEKQKLRLSAVKGQITGPVTFGTGVKDQDDRSIFYNHQLRDAAIKLLALKAAWQVEHLARFQVPVLLFFDEPALAGFGSSELISISKQDVIDSLNQVMEPVRRRQALAGVHVCANADWSVILSTDVDILSFDAFAYFEKLVMYETELGSFLRRGGLIAWGIVPTQDLEALDRARAEDLRDRLEEQFSQLEKLGISRKELLSQSLISPSCGTGSLSLEHAEKVLALTREVSEQIRGKRE